MLEAKGAVGGRKLIKSYIGHGNRNRSGMTEGVSGSFRFPSPNFPVDFRLPIFHLGTL